MLAERSALVRSWVEIGFNTGDLTSLAESCHPDVSVYAHTFDTFDGVPAPGVRRIAPLLLGFRYAFPPGVFEVDDVVVGEAFTSCRWTGRGRHERPLFGIPATNRRVALEGSCRFLFVDGRVKTMWFDFSLYSLFDQLGRICAGPGEGSPRSMEINRLAMDLWRQAVLDGDTAAFDGICEKRVAVCWQVNMNSAGPSPEVGAPRSARNGVDLTSTLVSWLRESLSGMEIAVDEGVSQGRTTTFRGEMRGTSKTGQSRRLRLRCSFVTADERIIEYRVEARPVSVQGA
jgi:hypothetical protein